MNMEPKKTFVVFAGGQISRHNSLAETKKQVAELLKSIEKDKIEVAEVKSWYIPSVAVELEKV